MEKLLSFDPFLLILNGICGSGKTHFMKYLLYRLTSEGFVDYCIVFSPTKFTQQWNMLPEKYIFPEFNDETLQKIMEIQEKQQKKQLLLIFDDCLGSVKFNSKVVSRFFSCFRHYRAKVMLSTQNVNKIPPMIRDIASHIAIFETFAERCLTGLYDSYGHCFERYEDFRKYVKTKCRNYSFILFSKRKEKDDPFHYRIFKCPNSLPRYLIRF